MKTTLLLMLATMLILTPQETLASDLTSLSPGKNEIQIEHDGRSRRLIVTTPKTFDRHKASIQSYFASMVQEGKLTARVKGGVHTLISMA